eukprot:5984716-Pleurochrysis_carterae.AAC.4
MEGNDHNGACLRCMKMGECMAPRSAGCSRMYSAPASRAARRTSSSFSLGRGRPRNMPSPSKFAAPRGTTELTGTKRPQTRAWNPRDEASRLENRRRDAPRREAPRHDDSRRGDPPRRSRTP